MGIQTCYLGQGKLKVVLMFWCKNVLWAVTTCKLEDWSLVGGDYNLKTSAYTLIQAWRDDSRKRNYKKIVTTIKYLYFYNSIGI